MAMPPVTLADEGAARREPRAVFLNSQSLFQISLPKKFSHLSLALSNFVFSAWHFVHNACKYFEGQNNLEINPSSTFPTFEMWSILIFGFFFLHFSHLKYSVPFISHLLITNFRANEYCQTWRSTVLILLISLGPRPSTLCNLLAILIYFANVGCRMFSFLSPPTASLHCVIYITFYLSRETSYISYIIHHFRRGFLAPVIVLRM